jgi:CubicO group peptidase (beta-lactamase class C family)
MARQKPEWQPGTRQAYYAISLGFYEGELMRRVDPRHRTLGQFFQDEIATPLGLDVYIRLPESFGPPGPGGSLGFADPTTGVGYGYVTSQMGTHLTGDPRDVALRDALDAVIRSRGGNG